MLAQAETEPRSFPMPCALCNRWVVGWRHYTDASGGLGCQLFYCEQCKDSVALRATLDPAGLADVLKQVDEEAMVHYLPLSYGLQGGEAG